MQQSNIPPRFPIPFANTAGASYVRQVPTASQIGISDGAASLTDGFPPDCFTAESAGGIPPDGRDFNGILRQLSQWARWTAAGSASTFDSAFSTAIGGYPKGARLVSSANPAVQWVNLVDGNMTDPDGSGSANWYAESDLGHIYDPNWGFITIGFLIVNFGNVALTDNSGRVTVSFRKPFFQTVLASGASNACGGGFPSATAGTGNATLTTMNVGMSVSGPSGGAFVAAAAGTAASWFAIGV